MEKLAPIVAFVYARPEHTKNMLESLSKDRLAKESSLYIYCDNAKKEAHIGNVLKVREYIHSIEDMKWFKEIHIIESEKNKGLANSVIGGVTEIINKFDKVIVLEDDLVFSTEFLTYMNKALEFYKNDSSIWSISGYNPPLNIPNTYKSDVYLGYRGCSWGWATWKDRWNTIDWNVSDYEDFKYNYSKRKKLNRGGPDMAQMLDMQMNKLCDSWAIRWCYEQSKQEKYTIYPVKSLVVNQGLDGTGTHSGNIRNFDVVSEDYIPKLEKNLNIDKKISKEFSALFNEGIKQKVKEILIILKLEKFITMYRKVKKCKQK